MFFFLKYTFLNFFLFLKALVTSPFSQLSRHRLTSILLTLRYPYFGDKYVHLSQLLNNEELQVIVAPVKARLHNTSSFELLAICSLLKDNKCNVIFEIGTFDGRTARAMAMNLLNTQGEIFTLNLPPETDTVELDTSIVDVQLARKVISGERFINTAEHKNIKQLWGDSATYDFSPYHNKMDMVFIDGAHSEYYVKSDTENGLKLVKQSGGVIIWHDAHLYGVVKYLQQWRNKNKLELYFIKETSLAVARVKNGSVVDFFTN